MCFPCLMKKFDSIYDARYSLEASVMEYSSFSALDQLDKISQDSSLVFEQVRSDTAGVVSYGIDSYESLQPSDIEAESFNKANYTKKYPQIRGSDRKRNTCL